MTEVYKSFQTINIRQVLREWKAYRCPPSGRFAFDIANQVLTKPNRQKTKCKIDKTNNINNIRQA